MRFLRLSFLALLGAAGCGPQWAVVPRGGLERVVAQGEGPAQGVTMVAFANQWDAYPYDLADYVTPIAVELYNGGKEEVRVSYADLALRDQSGFRYAAINPYIPATTVGENTPSDKPVLLAANGPMVVATRGAVRIGAPSAGRIGTPLRMGPPPATRFNSVRVGPPPQARGGVWVGPPAQRRWGYGSHGWHGYLIAGGLRPYYGWGVGYWGGPWIYPPYYNEWVMMWGPSYYPSRPSSDVLSLGLPEGVLPPGARISGFLYFKRATGTRQGALDLSWDIHDARTGASLGTLHAPLEVVRR